MSPFQGLVFVIMVTQGGAARLAPLRSALGWCVEAPSGRELVPPFGQHRELKLGMAVRPPRFGALLLAGSRSQGQPGFMPVPAGDWACGCFLQFTALPVGA